MEESLDQENSRGKKSQNTKQKLMIGYRYIRHHLLDNFDDPTTYDGNVRSMTFGQEHLDLSPLQHKWSEHWRIFRHPSGSWYKWNENVNDFNDVKLKQTIIMLIPQLQRVNGIVAI
ncbi:hypothetical protein QR98_0036510 [Sarcoptes scabiei]|uniref:Uncharacterized protein n=1 Tax=Sarcoptes scabiei TaxID=52283 RepID=A0A132A2D5_SARSC|nr:hypothetical protein QR98_0036510 [Sarcoptes scabiei]